MLLNLSKIYAENINLFICVLNHLIGTSFDSCFVYLFYVSTTYNILYTAYTTDYHSLYVIGNFLRV